MRLVTAFLVLGPLGVAACTSSNTPPDDGTYNCANDTRGQEYVMGLENAGEGGALDFKLTADPAPPLTGDNDWTVQINAMASGVVGEPAAGATVHVSSYMPDHMHTSPIPVKITDKGGGLYDLKPVNLWMPGVWETTISVTTATGTDSTVYRFCLPN